MSIRLLAALLPAILLAARPGTARAQGEGESDTGFELSLLRRTEAPPGTDLFIRTTAIYPCAGYRVLASLTRRGDTIAVDIRGLQRPSPCFASADAAEGSVFIGSFGGGSYLLRLRYRGRTDLHRIAFTTTRVRTSPLHATFTTLKGY